MKLPDSLFARNSCPIVFNSAYTEISFFSHSSDSNTVVLQGCRQIYKKPWTPRKCGRISIFVEIKSVRHVISAICFEQRFGNNV